MQQKPLPKDPKKVKNKRNIKRSSKQRRKYSGKKKRHTHKIQMVVDADTKQIISVHFEKGACHDFKLYKKSKLRIHPNIVQKTDSGYLGVHQIHQNSQIPHKNSKYHQLTKTQRKENRQLAKERLAIEHKNAKLKVFKLAQNHYRSHTRFALRITLIATFINANLF